MKPINGILAAAVSSLFLFNLPTAAMADDAFQVYEAFSDDSEIELLCVHPSGYRAFYKNGQVVDQGTEILDLDAIFAQASASGDSAHGQIIVLTQAQVGNCAEDFETIKATSYETSGDDTAQQ